MKNAIITGGTGEIGTEIAKNLINTGIFNVTIIGQSKHAGEIAISKITKKNPKAQVKFISVDVSNHDKIIDLAKNWKEPLDLLMNVASITPKKREETEKGIEKQFATNVLGYYWMITEFQHFMKKGSRIVNVASYWAGDLNIDDLEFKKRVYDNDIAYRQSKQCERMLTAFFAENLKNEGISVNSCHPGDVNSKLSRNLGYGGHESPEEGAETPTFVAISKELEGITGKYFQHKAERIDALASDRDLNRKLAEICSKY